MNILSSFTVYTAALHALILILFSLHTSGLGYPGLTWNYCISTNKSFSSPKTSSMKPYSKPRGQRRAPTPAHPRQQQEWRRTDSPPRGRTVGGERAPDRRRPSQRTPYPHTRARSTWAAGPDSPQEEGSRRGESARPRTPLATGPPQTAGEGAPSAHTHTRMPARGTGVRAPPPTPRRAHSTCTSHGKSAPHPLLLGTATQQWRNPRPHAKHTPDLRRWTQHTRSSGHGDSETAKETPHKGTRARTPTWRKYRSPPGEARPRNLRRQRAAWPPSAPRGNGATAPAKAGAPNSTLSPVR